MRIKLYVRPGAGSGTPVTWDQITVTWNEATGTWNAPDAPEMSYKHGSLILDRDSEGRISVAEFTTGPLERGASWIIPACGDTVFIQDADTTDYLFLGAITRVEPQLLAGTRIEVRVACQDYTYLLDAVMVTNKTYTSQTDEVILDDLFTTYLPAISTAQVVSVDTVDSLRLDGVTLRAAVEQIAKLTNAIWYVDPYSRLQYFSPGSVAAPFSLVERESANYINSFPYMRNPDYVEEFGSACNFCTVYGKLGDGGVEVWGQAQNLASQSDYGTYSRVLVDRSIQTNAEAQMRAEVEVANYAYPRVSASISFLYSGLSVGQAVTVVCGSHGMSGAYVIRRLRMQHLDDNAGGTAVVMYTADIGAYRPDLLWIIRDITHRAQQPAEMPAAMPPDGSLTDVMAEQPGQVIKTGDIFNGTVTVIAITDAASGARRVMLDITYSPPVTLSSFMGVDVYLKYPDGRVLSMGPYDYQATHPAADIISVGPLETAQVSELVTVYLCEYSLLVSTKLNTSTGGTPRRTVTIDPTAGLDGAKISPSTLVTAAFASSIRPVTMGAGLPALPNALYPAGSVYYNTSDQTMNKVAPAGTSWVKLVDGSKDVVASSITAGQVAAGAIGTTQLYAGEILVGGGGGKPARFRVNDAVGTMVGFIGDNGAGFIGSYFVNCRIGPDINNPVILANAAGITIDGAPIYLTKNGIVTTINSLISGSTYSGVRVALSAFPTFNTDITPQDVVIRTNNTIRSWLTSSFGYGELILTDAIGPNTTVDLRGEAGTGAFAGAVNAASYQVAGVQVISSGKVFTGYGIDVGTFGIRCRAVNPIDALGYQMYGQDTAKAYLASAVLATKNISLRKVYSGGYLADVFLQADGVDVANVDLGYTFTAGYGVFQFTGGILVYAT